MTAIMVEPGVVLSDAMSAALEFLCFGGGTSTLVPLATYVAAVSGSADPNHLADTIGALIDLGYVIQTKAGGLDPLYHLTETGRALACADTETDEQEDYPMTNTETQSDLTTVKPDPKPQKAPKKNPRTTAAEAVAAKDAAKDPAPPVEDVTGQPNAAIEKGKPTVAAMVLFQETVDAIVALTDGSTVDDKGKYVRILTSAGKPICCVDKPTSRGGAVVAIRLSVKTKKDAQAAVKAVEPRAKALAGAAS